MSNKIQDLRDHLFETIKMLKDPNSKMDVEKAKAISEISQVIINSAKVEVEYMKNVGGLGSGFIPMQPLKLEEKKDK
jgi:hypothetical protein